MTCSHGVQTIRSFGIVPAAASAERFCRHPHVSHMTVLHAADADPQPMYAQQVRCLGCHHCNTLPCTGICQAGTTLQVQFWHRGEDDRLYCMLPYSVPAPCWARQVFTTVHDNEETVRTMSCWLTRLQGLA